MVVVAAADGQEEAVGHLVAVARGVEGRVGAREVLAIQLLAAAARLDAEAAEERDSPSRL